MAGPSRGRIALPPHSHRMRAFDAGGGAARSLGMLAARLAKPRNRDTSAMIDEFVSVSGMVRSECLAPFPPPMAKADLGLRHVRGGRTECHEFSSLIGELSAHATGELSSMAFQVGVRTPHMPPVTARDGVGCNRHKPYCADPPAPRRNTASPIAPYPAHFAIGTLA